MRDNVIEFPKQGGRLGSRILERSRLDGSDKAKFAENLGRLAAMVNPSDPLAGAQRIITGSRLDGIWEKRKRYFRLPGEAAPASTKDGEYGSRPSTFVTLARAAARLIIGSDQPDRIEAEERRAIKKLAEGSSFAPAFVPLDPQDQTAKSLLDDFAARLSAAIVERTRLVELWRVLETSPFFVDAMTESELPTVGPSPYGSAGEFPPSLLSTRFNDWVVAARFVTEHPSSRLAWANPRIKIGRVAITTEARIFLVPTEIGSLLASGDYTDKAEKAQQKGIKWIEKIIKEYGGLPEEDEYWHQCFFSKMCDVFVEIFPNDMSPKFNMFLVHDFLWPDNCSFSDPKEEWSGDRTLPKLERDIFESDFKHVQVRCIESDRFGDFTVVHEGRLTDIRKILILACLGFWKARSLFQVHSIMDTQRKAGRATQRLPACCCPTRPDFTQRSPTRTRRMARSSGAQ